MKSLLFLATTATFGFAGELSLIENQPAKNWERDTFPIGNGSLGACLYGGTDEARMQFTCDTFWSGNENATGKYIDKAPSPGADHFGAYQSFGELVTTDDTPASSIKLEGKVTVSGVGVDEKAEDGALIAPVGLRTDAANIS